MNDIYVGTLFSEDYLAHYGVLGMKWGVRRYENKNGTLTEAGKKRYSKNSSDKRKPVNAKKVAKGVATAAAIAIAAYGGYKLYKSGKVDSLIASGKKALNSRTDRLKKDRDLKKADAKVKAERREIARNRRHLTIEEINKHIDRLQKERQLRILVEEDTEPGRKVAKDILQNSGKKALNAAVAGAMIYGGKVALDGKFDRKQAAGYLFPKPKNK